MSFHAVFKDEIQTNGFRTNLLNNYYQFHFWVVDSDPHGWDTSPYGPAGGSRSSFPGYHWMSRTHK